MLLNEIMARCWSHSGVMNSMMIYLFSVENIKGKVTPLKIKCDEITV